MCVPNSESLSLFIFFLLHLLLLYRFKKNSMHIIRFKFPFLSFVSSILCMHVLWLTRVCVCGYVFLVCGSVCMRIFSYVIFCFVFGWHMLILFFWFADHLEKKIFHFFFSTVPHWIGCTFESVVHFCQINRTKRQKWGKNFEQEIVESDSVCVSVSSFIVFVSFFSLCVSSFWINFKNFAYIQLHRKL